MDKLGYYLRIFCKYVSNRVVVIEFVNVIVWIFNVVVFFFGVILFFRYRKMDKIRFMDNVGIVVEGFSMEND